MTDLIVRKMRFAFADHYVPFLWNEQNPAFSSMANAVSFLAIAFEKMVVSMISEAKPMITDPAIAEEADAFVRQEGQHSMAHRQHARGLIKSYPALKETLDEVIAAFDDLTASKPLKYRLAYTADLEATFTPAFKLMLDHDDTLFAPGDDRVASLFLWHFVEEVEHRSSALIIYDAVVDDPWYRMRVAPSIFKHVWSALQIACHGFNKHVPVEERKVDALSMFGMQRQKKALMQRLPFFDVADDGPLGNAFGHLPWREQLIAMFGVVRSQIPGHNPAHENLPALADEWFKRYAAGYDVTQWYTAPDRQLARDR
ncbi:metal-dependent hydrolase [Mycobacterium marinum]|uniref:metal-dependent hydrolase n=1 Tax=Mycobacterium marinum TaxID=1781 RepID=UPI000B96372E|nr:metal-dependent hydrolase [Mycobacterium marinum]MDC8985607.1 metal-dependent hydrolase [Mycobacterium marinum]MDC8997479.1 metal-dependent hydrolase [Mycobacterium marinum]MDC9000789.1 metal-dependent hydrolase [Mycobacterium marinum]MDC9011055.1 metal-dependent hydrolase [Mycobacterium marinum]MDC9018995.1 metal-dependent hydrolase [Mycobacterium marinum]